MQGTVNYVVRSDDIGRLSRNLIPYLYDPNTNKEMLSILSQNMKSIPEFLWTAEQFELLASLDFQTNIEQYLFLFEYNLPFLIFLSKHFKTPINLQLDATPDNILSYLDDSDMVTIINTDIQLDNGFLIPCPYITTDESRFRLLCELRIFGMTDEEIMFWYPGMLLHKVELWSLVSMDYLKQCAQQGDSFPMLFIDRSRLYPSLRPITDMSMFQTPLSTYYDNIPNNSIPVTRYAQGMSKGKYYDERPRNVCGYFYYSEPTSTTYLKYDKVLTSFNKTTALQQLQYGDIYEHQHQFTLKDHINGVLPQDLMMTAKEYADYVNNSKHHWNKITNVPDNDRKVYVGKILGLYAAEDALDQELCQVASAEGYQLVILTHMIGSHQIVTEVLDTRSDSFSHLSFLR